MHLVQLITSKFTKNERFQSPETRATNHISVDDNNQCFETTNGNIDLSSITCVNGKCYIAVKAINARRSWLDAQSCCNSIGANLAKLNSDSHFQQIYDGISDYYSQNAGISYVWIGAFNKPWTPVAGKTSNC